VWRRVEPYELWCRESLGGAVPLGQMLRVFEIGRRADACPGESRDGVREGRRGGRHRHLADARPVFIRLDEVDLNLWQDEMLASADHREQLHRLIAGLRAHGQEVLGRWADVMVNSGTYAEIVDRHVELYSRLYWWGSVLDESDPLEALNRPRLSRLSPATQASGPVEEEWLRDNLVTIAAAGGVARSELVRPRDADRPARVVNRAAA
jgi:hypothetical protein